MLRGSIGDMHVFIQGLKMKLIGFGVILICQSLRSTGELVPIHLLQEQRRNNSQRCSGIDFQVYEFWKEVQVCGNYSEGQSVMTRQCIKVNAAGFQEFSISQSIRQISFICVELKRTKCVSTWTKHPTTPPDNSFDFIRTWSINSCFSLS